VKRRAVLALAVLAGLLVRLLPLPRVLSIAYVDFQGDGWYHLRRLDWLLANFPRSLTYDPYVGQFVPLPPLFDLLVAAIVSLAGFPEAGTRTAEVMAALAPALMGALVALPSFGQARLLFDERSAAWAGFLVVLLPGPFLIRSLMGVTDHHVAEVLFSSLTLFLVTRASLRDDRWTPAAAGLALGSYFLCWSGAPFVVSGLLAWGVLEYTRGFVLGRGVPAISRALGPAAAIALALVLFFQPKSLLRYETHHGPGAAARRRVRGGGLPQDRRGARAGAPRGPRAVDRGAAGRSRGGVPAPAPPGGLRRGARRVVRRGGGDRR
jgi:asparagine N-glycosylation enzyme membrane subunit Stt3